MTAPEDALEERLDGALRELGQQAPEFDTDTPALGRPPQSRSGAQRHTWARPLAAAALVAAIGGVAAVTWQHTSGGGGASVGIDHDVASTSTPSPSTSTPTHAAVSKFAVDRRAAQATAFELEPGYGRVSVDYAEGAVDVLWKGTPPAALEKLAARRGAVTLTIHEARYSEADTNAAARRLFQAKPSEVDGAKVVLVTSKTDQSGVTASVLRPWDGDWDMLRDVAGMPVDVALVDEGPQPARG